MIVADLAGITRARGERTIVAGLSWTIVGPEPPKARVVTRPCR